jgi:hypothetical protein
MNPASLVNRRGALAALAASVLAASPASASGSDAPEPFSAPRDRGSFERALQCLTEAVYYEARSESDDGQRAVAQVVLNRVRHPSYPNSVCGVVYQGSHRRTGCQFTFTCDGSISGYIDGEAWARAQRIAQAALRGSVYRPVGLSLNYHTTAIRPYWAPSLVRHAVIGAHIFYRRPGHGSIEDFDQDPAAAEPRTAYASAASSRASRAQPGRSVADSRSARIQVANIERYTVERPRIERPTVERPRIERVSFERPVSSRTSRALRTAASPQLQSQARTRTVPARPGPRTTIEGGVRVARGS